MNLHWDKGDYFGYLANSRDVRKAYAALELLIDDLHLNKNATISHFLSYCGSEDALWTIVRLLANSNPRVSGNAAFILGTLAENEVGRERVAALAAGSSEECRQILSDISRMFLSDDSESIMNAVGALGTLAESERARTWLLADPCINNTMKCVADLLNCPNIWTSSNAALLLARLLMSDDGCQRLLNHTNSDEIINRLINSLGLDEAGRGLNAAFAIGRLCDMEVGVTRLLLSPSSDKMISSLIRMLLSDNSSACKNSCFAISCIAACHIGHARLLGNTAFNNMVSSLASMLSSDDHEAAWFAAMTLHTLAKQSKGCLRLRENERLLPILKAVEKRSDAGDDLRKEIVSAIDLLKPLDKPLAPTATVVSATQVDVEWQPLSTCSKRSVSYQVFEGSRCVYEGQDLHCVINDLHPFTRYSICLAAFTEIDRSAFSDPVVVTTLESVPDPPLNLQVLATTTTQIKVSWLPPEDAHGVLHGYYVYIDKNLVEQTTELSTILSGLQPGTSYEISVCAYTSKGKGECDGIVATTAKLGMHFPAKPEVSVRGRSELHVAWQPPQFPLGRITRYELSVDGEVVYAGTELHYVVRRLKADTEYSFTVTVVTSEGKFESKPTLKRTAKDEFEQERTPLYQPPVAPPRKDSCDAEDDASRLSPAESTVEQQLRSLSVKSSTSNKLCRRRVPSATKTRPRSSVCRHPTSETFFVLSHSCKRMHVTSFRPKSSQSVRSISSSRKSSSSGLVTPQLHGLARCKSDVGTKPRLGATTPCSTSSGGHQLRLSHHSARKQPVAMSSGKTRPGTEKPADASAGAHSDDIELSVFTEVQQPVMETSSTRLRSSSVADDAARHRSTSATMCQSSASRVQWTDVVYTPPRLTSNLLEFDESTAVLDRHMSPSRLANYDTMKQDAASRPVSRIGSERQCISESCDYTSAGDHVGRHASKLISFPSHQSVPPSLHRAHTIAVQPFDSSSIGAWRLRSGNRFARSSVSPLTTRAQSGHGGHVPANWNQ